MIKEGKRTGLVVDCLSFAIMALFGKLSTRVAVSCVLPPTRIRTLPARSTTVASRLRKGTWMNDLQIAKSAEPLVPRCGDSGRTSSSRLAKDYGTRTRARCDL